MMLEFLSEVVPGFIIIGSLLLWWQARLDIRALRTEWRKARRELVLLLTEAKDWEAAVLILQATVKEKDL